MLYLKVCDNYSFSYSFLILDLPKLHTISFNGGYVLNYYDECDNYNDSDEYFRFSDIKINKQKTIINSHESYDNTLIMKGM